MVSSEVKSLLIYHKKTPEAGASIQTPFGSFLSLEETILVVESPDLTAKIRSVFKKLNHNHPTTPTNNEVTP